MTYDERIRDPELRSQLADEGLSDDAVSKIYLELLRTFFLNANNFGTKVLRNRVPALVWSEDVSESAIRIVRADDWVPENMGKAPEVVIRSQGTTWASQQVGGIIDVADNDRVDDPDVVSSIILSRAVVWAISASPTEAKNVSWEIAMFFAAYARPIQQEFGFQKVVPGGVGGAIKVKERKGYWGCPVVIASQWELTQELIEQQPRLGELKVNQTTDEADYRGS